jgi:hypothetical protein
MLQETVTIWDLRNVSHSIPLDEKLFVYFTIILSIVTSSKILRSWLLAPRFRRALPTEVSAYERYLRASAISLQHWLLLPFFAWAFLSCWHLCADCTWYMTTKSTGTVAFVGDLRELLSCLVFALAVALFVFLGRWHVLSRIDRLRA